MLSIEPATENPFFAYPALKAIWPPLSQAIAEEATEETLAAEEDGIFLIKKDNQVIGMSGYFIIDNPEEAYLRWHGIIPSERQKGYSKEALTLILQEVQKDIPEAKRLVELVPVTEYSGYLIEHFERLGFKPRGTPQTMDWTPNLLQEYVVDIADFLKKYAPSGSSKAKQVPALVRSNS